ncbi:conserved hypothetical protein [Neospora caninum Liverpool]|uniref:Uncharacterized protein n=1 Tax=Neospora caninum (strain Liverpool) TaxID=572307 RepID=F0V7P9_NEOCL|nr:conserved hypothetical protein [Neospora caninum Liverpool]CBZ49740.1 conserved hypothetical protein [Neospora caninum Liverpool]|eukprot:XP_003879775.1 conserved hypothetical protein [Neospora caninum Liverpool]
MRSMKHLAAYLLQFSQTVPAANSAEAYMDVLSRLERDSGLMDCDAIRRAATAIANFRRGRNSPLASREPRRFRPYDGERERTLRGTGKARREKEAAEWRGLLGGGQRRAGIFSSDFEPEAETSETVRLAEDRAVEALMKQAGEQLLEATPLRTACRLLALFAVYFRLFYLPFYAAFSLKFCQQYLRASGQELADVAHAFALLHLKDAHLFESVATASATILSTFSPTHLSRLLLSFALVGLSCESLFLDAAPHIARMSARFSPEEVGHLAFAHARFRLCTLQLQSILAARVPDILPHLSSPQLAELVISMRQLRVPLSLDAQVAKHADRPGSIYSFTSPFYLQAQLAEHIDLSELDWELLGAFLSALSPLQALPTSFWQQATTECLSRLLLPLTSMELLAAREKRRERGWRDVSDDSYGTCEAGSVAAWRDFESGLQQLEVSSQPLSSLPCSLGGSSAVSSSPVSSSASSHSARNRYTLPPDLPVFPLPAISALVDCFLSFSALFAGSLSGSTNAPGDLLTSLPAVLAALARCLCSSLASPGENEARDAAFSSASEECGNPGRGKGATRKELVDALLPADVARLYRALRGGVRSHWDVEKRKWKETKECATPRPQSIGGFDAAPDRRPHRGRTNDGEGSKEETLPREGAEDPSSSHVTSECMQKSGREGHLKEAQDGAPRQQVMGDLRHDDLVADGEEGAWIDAQVNSLRHMSHSAYSWEVMELSCMGRSARRGGDEREQARSAFERLRCHDDGDESGGARGSIVEGERGGDTDRTPDTTALWMDAVVGRATNTLSSECLGFDVGAEEGEGEEAGEGDRGLSICGALCDTANSLASGEGQDGAILRLEMGLLRRFLSLDPGAFSLAQLLAITYSLIALYPPPARAVASPGSLRSLQSLPDRVDAFPFASSSSTRRTQLHTSLTKHEGNYRKALQSKPPPCPTSLSQGASGAFLEVACRGLASALCRVQKKEGVRDDEPAQAIQYLPFLQQFLFSWRDRI